MHTRIQIYWCRSSIFRHLKLELLTQFPASNDEKYINVVYIWRKFVSFYGYVHWRMTTEISVMYGSEKVNYCASSIILPTDKQTKKPTKSITSFAQVNIALVVEHDWWIISCIMRVVKWLTLKNTRYVFNPGHSRWLRFDKNDCGEIEPFCASKGIDFRRQDLTTLDVRFVWSRSSHCKSTHIS